MFDIDLGKSSNKSKFWKLRNNVRVQPEPWGWPLARLGSRSPIILAEHVLADRRGLDLGYVAASMDDQLYVPVYAAQGGEVAAALETSDGFAISIEHGSRSSITHYAHLSKMFVTPCVPKLRRRQYVRAGDVIGYTAKSPLHVRFELWRWDEAQGYVVSDAAPELARWTKPLTSVDVRHLVSEAA